MNGRLGLLLHAAGQALGRGLFEPGGVDDGKIEIAQSSPPDAAVAGHAGQIIDQRQAFAHESIEQRGFADVRPSHDGDRKGHFVLPAGWRKDIFRKRKMTQGSLHLLGSAGGTEWVDSSPPPQVQ